MAAGGVNATIKLEPVTLVRLVKVDIDKQLIDRIIEPVFEV